MIGEAFQRGGGEVFKIRLAEYTPLVSGGHCDPRCQWDRSDGLDINPRLRSMIT